MSNKLESEWNVKYTCNCFGLCSNNVYGRSRFSLLKRFTNTSDYLQTLGKSVSNLVSNKLGEMAATKWTKIYSNKSACRDGDRITNVCIYIYICMYYLIWFIKKSSSFRMADDNPRNTQVGKHFCTDLTGECTSIFNPTILGCNLKIRPQCSFNWWKKQKWWAHYNLCKTYDYNNFKSPKIPYPLSNI